MQLSGKHGRNLSIIAESLKRKPARLKTLNGLESNLTRSER